MAYPFLASRLAAIQERIAAACARAGRSSGEVTVVAVTKTHPAEAISAVVGCGLVNVGENKVQELEGKVAELGRGAAKWHLIGHLQTNKASRAVELADLIHSIDSLKIARKLSEEAKRRSVVIEGLIQINVGGEATKGGLEPDQALDGIAEICELPGLKVRGLMAMAPFTEDEAIIRRVFGAVRLLKEQAASLAGFDAVHLSMGMSNDFEIAVEEGSTLLRLGTVLFGERGV